MKITIPGNPIPKARHRQRRMGKITVMFDPQEKQKKQVSNFIKSEIKKNAVNFDSDNDFHLEARFYMPIPQSDSTALKNAKLWGFIPCNIKPDLSNMLKFYEDAANQILFHDDSMISSCTMLKEYSKNPKTELNIMAKKKLVLNKKVESIITIFDPEEMQQFFLDACILAKVHVNDVCNFKNLDNNKKIVICNLIACSLSDFSIKYADKLKKIRKYDGVIDEMQTEITQQYRNGKTLC